MDYEVDASVFHGAIAGGGSLLVFGAAHSTDPSGRDRISPPGDGGGALFDPAPISTSAALSAVSCRFSGAIFGDGGSSAHEMWVTLLLPR
jgi:hypothetical protein